MTDDAAVWQPVVEEAEDVVTPAAAAALHGLLDAPGPPPAMGAPLPPLWHWLAFLPRTPQRDLGPDGHPRRGAFMPPAEGRRMFAGGHLELAAGLAVGDVIQRRSVVSKVEEKTGKSGRLVFVAVTHDLASNGRSALTETQDIVYRPPAPASTAGPPPGSPSPAAAGETWDWGFDLSTETTVLFRFSALTYNAHRIHYDRPYATEVEGYPGLVVHGPLQAIALAELCRRYLPERVIHSFRFRAMRPAFDGPPLRIAGRLADNGTEVSLAALDQDGEVTMRAEAILAPNPASP